MIASVAFGAGRQEVHRRLDHLHERARRVLPDQPSIASNSGSTRDWRVVEAGRWSSGKPFI